MTASPDRFDLTVIGSGPGGYVAAIRGAQLGLRTAVVERDAAPGGTCVHWGCIPAKALLRSAEVLDTARAARSFGVLVDGARLDLAGMHAYRTRTVQANVKGIEYLFRKHGITLLVGHGSLAGPGRVRVVPVDGSGAERVVETRFVLLAAGSAIRGLPGVSFDGAQVLNSDHALTLERVPTSMIVLGAGAVGVEFASAYRSFGAEVTLVEVLPRLLPLEDAALGQELERAFRKRGIRAYTATRVDRVERRENGVHLVATRSDETLELEAEVLLVAVGRRPRSEELGLDGTRVRVTPRGFVEVDERMRTGEPGVFAIGDLVDTPALAHVASHEGIVAVEQAAGREPRPVDYDRIPSCTYCHPEVAAIGLSEERARERGHDVVVGSFPFSALGKARILNDTGGLVKVVVDRRSDEILGVHIVGPQATELISEATAALNLEATAESLFHAVHAHPTLSEALGEAALAAHGRAIHI